VAASRGENAAFGPSGPVERCPAAKRFLIPTVTAAEWAMRYRDAYWRQHALAEPMPARSENRTSGFKNWACRQAIRSLAMVIMPLSSQNSARGAEGI